MESIAAEQISIAKEIEKIIANYQRESPDKKTLQYLQEKLTVAKNLFERFEKNHKEIKTKYSSATEHSYFTKDYYNVVKKPFQGFESEVVQLIEYAQKNTEKQKQNNSDPKATTSSNNTNTGRNDEDDRIIRLIRRQNSIMTTLKNTINGIIFDDTQTKQYYEVKMQAISQYWYRIEENNTSVWEIAEDIATCGYDQTKYFELQDEVQAIIAKINQEIDKKVGSTNNTTTNSFNSSANQNCMKLPKVVLPKFDGDYLKWQQFYDLFTQMVHKQSMGNSQKMWYLKTNLSGEAEKLIRHLPLTDNNYTIAWDILKSRYQNTRLLVTALLDKLIAQPAITVESATTLKLLHDTTKECLLSLQNLGIAVKDYWDPIIIHIIMKKLDKTTHALYEQSLTAPRDLQSVEKLLNFLELRFQALEALGQKANTSKGIHKPNKPSVLVTNKTSKIECPVCKKNHAVYYCETFLKLSALDRQDKAKELNLCLNCLKKGHTFSKCLSRGCQKCNKKHNTLLHIQGSTSQAPRYQIDKSTSNQTTATNLAAQTKDISNGYVFLGTARADILDADGKLVQCRILLDSGSQLNFITEKLRRKLRLAENKINLNISGIGDSKIKVNNRLNITLKSKYNTFETQLEVYVIKEIAAHQPQQYINTDNWDIPSNLTLADPEFNTPQKIDILLGAEVYGEIMRNGQLKLNENLPMLQNTTLGWMVLGKVTSIDYNTPFCGITNIELEKQLQRFWEIEEYPNMQIISGADRKCEEYYESTTTRNIVGRFMVNLPLLSDPNLLGESKEIAFKRLLSIERKLQKDPELRNQYNAFLDEYRNLGHMIEVEPEKITKPYCFLPHHFVLKPDSSTTKLRVVFDASAKTSNNLSLNDLLLKGPKVQEDISSIIMRFRLKKYVFTADITKMYRQIIVAEEDRNLQLIMWRRSPTEQIKFYQLCTVTYGTKSAPYLAIKCLQKLAEEERHEYPLGAAAIKDFYVDDVLTGSDNLNEALEIQSQVQSLLESGGFHLSKWCANHPKLVHNIPNEDLAIQLNFSEMDDDHIKTLGLVWHPITDIFTIITNLKHYKTVTKRTILADIAQIFDPLGLVNPVIVMGKIFIQKLWKLKIDWDDELPVELHSNWLTFRNELCKLKDLKIPRYIFNNETTVNMQMHAFADASEKAYGTAIYIRSVDKSGTTTVRLLCARSRVAPVKPITLARLELCAASLAAKAVDHLKSILNIKCEETYYWSDSEIVIKWIRGDPSVRKTFVANRVAAIQELTQGKDWRYVNTKENPADLVSRGLYPAQLKQSELWFNGPEFLRTAKSKWPAQPKFEVNLDEEDKPMKLAMTTTKPVHQHPLYTIEHGNSFRKLQRVMAYVLRSIRIFKYGKIKAQVSEFLTVKELKEALITIIKQVQAESFQDEIKNLKENKEILKSSKLKTLSPFLDSQGILRVGGRLEAANIDYDAKHPMVLPSDNFVTKLIMNQLHQTHLHAGPQALHAIARQNYWILQGRNIARSIVSNCVRCTKVRPRLFNQQMGNLPKDRVQRARPFINCGVDFCGPIYTHFKIRGKRPQKSYIAVFCCFTTKAVHLEVVSDLSTDGFLGALKRFISRRGKCDNMYCDNGTNFVGANNQLQEMYNILTNTKSKEQIINMCLDQKIQFHFIPPRSPHFGGLWEAAVKSIKYLLHRTISSASLTYEELCTVTTEIEAILNSRPLTPLSADPNDLIALTPAHFLIGETMINNVDVTPEREKMSLLARWELVNYLRNEFWKRWSMEYLGELQKRGKWTNSYPNIQPGSLVLIKEEHAPPLKWAMGRIEDAIPGPDGKVRVANVKTATGILRRSIHQLAPLPVDLEKIPENIEESTDHEMATEEPDLDHNYRNHRKRRQATERMSPMKVLLLTLLTLPLTVFSASEAGSSIDIRKLDNQAGIFFENLGISRLTTKNWNLMVYYDLTGYWATTSTIRQGLKQLERLSRTLNSNNYYVEIVNQYYHQFEEINANNVILENQSNLTTTRQKRSPLNIVGTVANKLFGILDHNYSKKMSETINKVRTNEDHLNELLKNQTSVLETTINVIKKSEEERLNQTKEIENALETVYQKMRNMNTEAKQRNTVQSFNTLSILIAALLNECRFMQDTILDVITDTHHGRANPFIISPDQIRSQITLIKQYLPTDCELPSFQGQINIALIYKLMNTQCHIDGGYVIFDVKIPLVSSTTFELYRLIPLPTVSNNTFVSIIPTSDFLMTNLYRDHFYVLNQLEFMHCMAIENQYYLCEQRHPILNKASKSSICEIELFFTKSLPELCTLKITKPTKVWIQLWSLNQWLFSVDQEYDIAFVCENGIIHRSLNGNGVLSMQGGCIMKDNEITLRALNIVQTQLSRESFQPNINITLDDINNSNNISTLVFKHSELINHRRELEGISGDIHNIKIQQTKLQELEPQNLHMLSVGYSAIGTIGIIIIYLITTHIRNNRNLHIISKSAPPTVTDKKPKDQDYTFEVEDFKGAQDVGA